MVLGVYLSLLLRPMVRLLARRHVSEPVGAALVLMALLGVVGGGVTQLTDPANAWLQRAPQSFQQVETKIRQLMQPARKVTQAAAQMEELAR